MYPVILQLGPVTLYTYGLLLVVAFATAAGLAARAARRWSAGDPPLSPIQVVDFCSVALFGGLVGGRLFYAALHWEAFLESPAEFFAIWHGGLVWYGGFLGGVLAAWGYARRQGRRLLPVLDQMIPFAALGHAIGRIGCFFNGCCFGRPGFAIPVQLLEAAVLAALFLGLRRLQRVPSAVEGRPVVLAVEGRLLGIYLAAYGLLRFGLEFLRGDQPPWWGGLTLQQLVSLGALAAGAALWNGWRGHTSSR